VLQEGMGRLLIDGSPGNEIVDVVKPVDGEVVLCKPGKGAFFMTGLNQLLRERGISHLIFCGVTTEVCVQVTMREANDRGYECVLVEDSTASYIPKFKAAVIDMVRSQGGIVGYTMERAEDVAKALKSAA
ncbi:rutB, partial [Symbiodinium sp. CCMP2456]